MKISKTVLPTVHSQNASQQTAKNLNQKVINKNKEKRTAPKPSNVSSTTRCLRWRSHNKLKSIDYNVSSRTHPTKTTLKAPPTKNNTSTTNPSSKWISMQRSLLATPLHATTTNLNARPSSPLPRRISAIEQKRRMGKGGYGRRLIMMILLKISFFRSKWRHFYTF
jgi:hypothetical protein